ncbi:hypothetical protein TEA_020991 [Camellia sinensis var. sinensis]|uniref:Uncharacterized protein n=1 Tax=Camellia sinensis var. sinensis TaxID=542762 RepID=A0A4V3WK23_CAMSN|nr:hypothetical protein TEA_020991 [Camellia sinensis var. sinensis]
MVGSQDKTNPRSLQVHMVSYKFTPLHFICIAFSKHITSPPPPPPPPAAANHPDNCNTTMAGASHIIRTTNPHRRTHRKTGFRRRFLYVYKQQRARFYIIGRCVSMLMCWHDHEVSD